METRKLRFILLAYLRGARDIIKKDYPHGVRSILRERLIISALDMEEAGMQGMAHETISTIFAAPVADPKRFKAHSKQMHRMVTHWHSIKTLDYDALERPVVKGSIDAMAKLYKALERSDFFDVIRETHFKINPEERPDGI